MTSILITGATGKQGGSLIRSLVSRNAPFEILAVTRNPTSTSAQKLKNLSSSIKLVEGDLDQPAAMFQKAQSLSSAPIWGVYSVQVNEFPAAIIVLPSQNSNLNSRQPLETIPKKHKGKPLLMRQSNRMSSSSCIAPSTVVATSAHTITQPISHILSQSTTSNTTLSSVPKTPR